MSTTINHLKLEKLTLRNFKGIRSYVFEPNGKSANVFGDNRTGKTTLADALTWLLFNKDTLGRSPEAFGIKTRDVDGEVLTGLEHEVEGVFAGGLKLRKVYKEKWTKPRGASKAEFSGHTTDHYFNDEPVQAGEYKERVEQIMSEELFKILTIPSHFPETMHWTDRREILFSLVGDVAPEDILAQHPELKRYLDVLDGKSEEAAKKILNEKKKRFNNELDNIPSRIDQETKGLYEVDGVEEAREKVEELKAEKQTVEAKRSQVESGGAVADLKVKKSELEANKAELKNEHQQKLDQALQEQREKVSSLQDKVDDADSEYRQAKRVYESSIHALTSAKDKIEKTREQIDEIKAREPKPESDFGPDVCPYCERPMEEGSDHDYQKYLQEFNAQKAEDLKEAKEMLASFQKEHEECKAENVEAKEKATKASGRLSQRKEALQKAEAELDRQKSEQKGVEFTEAWQELCAKVKQVEDKIENHQAETHDQRQKLDKLIEQYEAEIEEASKVIHQAEENKRTHNRIAELKAQQKQIQSELEQVEEDLYLIEEFVRARSAYVTDKVNEKFQIVNWRLFKEQINGGIEECCDAIKDGIPYGEGLNNGGRIQAGIDIINTLSKHFDKSAPVVIDNAESVTSLPDNDLQIIRLVVDEAYKKLEVEPQRELETA